MASQTHTTGFSGLSNTPKASLLTLPVELILGITTHLRAHEVALLAMSSHYLATAIGTRAFKVALGERSLKLQYMEHDEQHPDKFLCFVCTKVHKWESMTELKALYNDDLLERRTLYQGQDRCSAALYGTSLSPVRGINLNMRHLQLAARHARWGPSYGLDLSHFQTAQRKASLVHGSRILVSLETRIVGKRLLIKHSYEVRFVEPRLNIKRRQGRRDGTEGGRVGPKIRLPICNHLRMAVDNYMKRLNFEYYAESSNNWADPDGHWEHGHWENRQWARPRPYLINGKPPGVDMCAACKTDWDFEFEKNEPYSTEPSIGRLQTWTDFGDVLVLRDASWWEHFRGWTTGFRLMAKIRQEGGPTVTHYGWPARQRAEQVWLSAEPKGDEVKAVDADEEGKWKQWSRQST